MWKWIALGSALVASSVIFYQMILQNPKKKWPPVEKKKFFITSAIPYPNGKPHMGHALEIIQTDALARFYRLLGEEVVFQTGTDEHGKKNWQTAEKEGKTIHQFLEEHVALFKDLYQKLNISYSIFLRTSDQQNHYRGAQKLWQILREKGDIYKNVYQGLYCVGCECFKPEKELVNGVCPDHPTRQVEQIQEENYFFRLSKYKDQLIQIIENGELKIVPESRKSEILHLVKEAKDVSFSRPTSSLVWGIPVPDDPSHVMYVWCDALSNYITGPGYGSPEKEQAFSQVWPADIHVIGKDILRFHAMIWPAMLLSAGLPLPKELFVHGFLKLGGVKMGKTTGNVIDPMERIAQSGTDSFRFYILGSMSVEQDGEFSAEGLIERNNNVLVANFSNFCYRVLSLLVKNENSRIGFVDAQDTLIAKVTPRYAEVKKAFESRDFKLAVEEILQLSSLGNQYLQEKAPWTHKQHAAPVLAACANLVKNLAILLFPVTPGFSENLFSQLNLKKEELRWSHLDIFLQDHRISHAEILVKKITH